jgi:hypothetical protein
MRKPLAVLTGVTALLLAGPASAFEQTPDAPPPAAAQAAPPAKPPTAQLATSAAGVAQPAPAPSGAKVFGFGILPKLNFGLELLYGDKQQQDLELQQGALPDDNDVTVLGKFKRQF